MVPSELLLLEVIFARDVGGDFEGAFPDYAVEFEDGEALGGGCGG